MNKRHLNYPNKRKIWILCLLVILLAGMLVWINRNLFKYDQIFPVRFSYKPESDPQGNKLLTEVLSLPRGTYQVFYTGVNQNPHNGFVICFDGAEQPAIADTFNVGSIADGAAFEITEKIRKVQAGVYYSGESGDFRIENIRIHSDHVLQKSSFLRCFCESILAVLLFLILLGRFCFFSRYRKIFPVLSKPENERTFLFLLFLSAAVSVPLFNQSYIQAYDLIFHLNRIEGIKKSLAAGIFPAWIHLYFFNDYGYGSGFFYPDLFLYFPALLRLAGFSIMASCKIFSFSLNFAAVTLMFLAIFRISKSRTAGLISAVMYGFAAIRLGDLYTRAFFSEALGYVFIPLVCLGFYEIVTESQERWPIFAWGFTCLVFSHSISLALTGLFIIFMIQFYLHEIFSNPRALSAILKAFLLTAGLTAVYWLPMAEQLQHNLIRAGSLFSGYSSFDRPDQILSFQDLTAWYIPWKFIFMSPYFGYPLLIMPLFFIPAFKKIKSHQNIYKFTLALFIVGNIFLFMSLKIFPWKYFAWLLNRIQFSWRVLMISVFCFSALGGICLSVLFSSKSAKKNALIIGMVFAACGAGTLPLFQDIHDRLLVPDWVLVLSNNRVSAGEWMPANADNNFVDKNGNNVLSSDSSVRILSFDRRNLSFSFEFSRDGTGKFDFEVPLLYYAGYRAALEDENGKKLCDLPTRQGSHGLVSAEAEGVSSGKIRVWYQKTVCQILSEWISALSFLAFCLIYIRRKQKADRRNVPV